MSRLVEFRNRINHHFQREWLSHSQEQAYNRLRDLLSFQDTVNLCGPSGAGKTFLTWILGKELPTSVCFLARLGEVGEQDVADAVVIIADAHSPERSAMRETLTQLRGLGYKKVVFISDEPTTDQMPICQLILTTTDLRKIHQNWESVAIPIHELQESNESLNLHTALREIALNSLNLAGR